MRNLFFLLVLLLISGLAFGAAPQKLRVDQVQIGVSGSAGAKDISFDFGQGASNPKIQNNGTNFSLNQGANFSGAVNVTGDLNFSGASTRGNGTNASSLTTYDIGQGASNPVMGYDSTVGAMVFKNPGGPLKKLGSGSGGGEGGINILLNPNAEDGLVNWTNSGAGAFTEVFGTSEVLEGEKSFKFDSINTEDAVTSDLITLNDGLIGTSCEARIYYKGGDANLSFELVNGNGTVLKTQAITPHPIASHESLFFLCPNGTEIAGDANKGKLAVRVRQTTATNAIAITFDNMYLGSLIGLVETTLPDSCTVITSGSTVISDSCGGVLAYVVASGKIGINYSSLGLTRQPGVKFSGYYHVGVTEDARQSLLSVSNTQAVALFFSASGFYTPQYIAWTITKMGADAKQTVQVYKSIPKIADNVNEFSAYISSTGIVSGENVDWITGNCSKPSTGVTTCNHSAGEVLTCVVGSNNTDEVTSYLVGSSSASLAYFRSYLAGGISNQAFTVSCSRSADFKMPTVQPVIVGQVSNSFAESASTNVRTESCKIANPSGTATIDPTSGLCAGWVTSISRASAGLVTINFKPGTFSRAPVCTTAPIGGAAVIRIDQDESASSMIIREQNSTSGAPVDGTFNLTCQGAK